MRKFYSTLAVLAAAALALPGAAKAQANKLVVGMPTTPPNVVHMPVLVAKDLGLYKKYGVDVETVALEDGVKVFRAMLAGNLDVAHGARRHHHRRRSPRARRSRASWRRSDKFEASMVVRDNVKTMADLKGKRIGIQQPGGFADILSKAVLRAAKIDPKDVNFVTIASEDVPALVADQVDTAILHVEQEMLAKEKVPSLHAIARMWEIQPKSSITVYSVTRGHHQEQSRPRCRPSSRPTIEATRIIYTDKAKVLPILVKHTGYPEKIISDTYDFLVKSCIWDANTGLSPERINFTANLMTKVGNIEQGKTPTYDQIVDMTFAEKAIKRARRMEGTRLPDGGVLSLRVAQIGQGGRCR